MLVIIAVKPKKGLGVLFYNRHEGGCDFWLTVLAHFWPILGSRFVACRPVAVTFWPHVPRLIWGAAG